jgi:CheY-like chemotaxis protein
LCSAKNLRWTANWPNVGVITDRELLQRLLRNLLANAVRYTDSGEIRLDAKIEGDLLAIAISDTGPGIAESDRERIFDEFVQLANSARQREKGVGLGLAICRHISQVLAIPLTLESVPGHGSRFAVHVPLCEMPLVPAFGSGVLGRTQIPMRTSVRPALPHGSRVWVVEDDPLVRSALRALFDAWACPCLMASTREELIPFLADPAQQPTAIILDDMLGGKHSGLEIGLWLSDYFPRERILIVTGNTRSSRIDELHRHEFAVQAKPLAADELLEWLGRSHGKEQVITPPEGQPRPNGGDRLV